MSDTTRRAHVAGDRAFALAVFGVSLVLLGATAVMAPLARRVPLLVILPVGVLSCIQLIRPSLESPAAHAATRANWSALVWIAVLPVSIYLLGLYAGVGLFTLAFVRLFGRDSWPAAFGIAVGVTTGVWLLVSVLLGSTVPAGALRSWMGVG